MVLLENEQPEQGSFFTGLSNRNGTYPGHKMDNEFFVVTFKGIQCENATETQRRFVKDRFESCYDWQNVMELVLEALEYYYDEGDLQIDVEHSVRAWLRDYEGWGLLFTLLPMDFQKFLLVLYSHLNVNYSQENIVKTNEELFEDLVFMYETETQGLPLSDLVPKIQAKLFNVVVGPTVCERKKALTITFFSSRFQLQAVFIVDKKRLRRSLVEHSAEVVGRMVDDTEDLEIPETLKPLVSEKIVDADWVASHWWAKYRYQQQEKERKELAKREEQTPQTMKFPSAMTVFSFLFWSMRHWISSMFSRLVSRFR